MGLWGYRHRRVAASANADGAISLCRRHNALFREKIPGSVDARSNCPILLLAYLAAHCGRQVLTVITQHGHPVLIMVAGLITAGMAVLIFFLVRKRKKRARG